MRFACDIDARKAVVTMKHLAAVSSESGSLQAPARIFKRHVVCEYPDDASARVREGIRWGGAASHYVSLRSGSSSLTMARRAPTVDCLASIRLQFLTDLCLTQNG